MKKSAQSGFTLIEMLFYALFITVIIGGSLGIIHQLLKNSDSLKSGIAIEEEANFILRKIIWVLNDVETVNSPAINTESNLLSVNKNDFAGGNPVIVVLAGKDITIKRGSGPALPLNGERFTVSSLSFELFRENSDPKTDLLKASFLLNGKPFKLTWHIR